MRRILLLLLLALPAAGILAAGVSIEWALAQGKEDPKEAKVDAEPGDDEPVAPEKLGKLTLTLDPGGHVSGVGKVLFTPDGTLITIGLDHSIRLWDPLSGETRKVLYPPGIIATRKMGGPHGLFAEAALSRGGRRLALASYYWDKGKAVPVVYVLTLPEGRIEHTLLGHSDAIWGLAISSDGKRLVSGGKDKTYRIWNLETGKTEQEFKHPDQAFHGFAISPDGERLARVKRAGSHYGEIVELATGKELSKFKGRFVVWSPDGKTMATGDVDGLRLYESNGKLRSHLLEKTRIRAVSMSADSGALLVTWPGPRKVQNAHRATILDIATGKERMVLKEEGEVGSGALSADGQVAVTLVSRQGDPNLLFVWKTADGKLVRNLGQRPWLVGAGWSADGQVLTWDPRNKDHSFHLGKLQLGMGLKPKEFRGPVLQQGGLSLKSKGYFEVDILKDNKPLAKISKTADQTATSGREAPAMRMTFVGQDRVALGGLELRLYDAATGKELRRFQYQGKLSAIASSPDGRFLVSTGADQLLRVWNVEQDQALLSLYVRGKDWIAWTPEGYYAATPGGERIMGWKVDNGIDKATNYFPAERFRKQMYRPDVIQMLLKKGNLKDALESANADLKKEGKVVAGGVADLNKLLPPQATLQILDKKDLSSVRVKASAGAAVKEQPVMGLRLLLDGRPLPDRACVLDLGAGKDKAWTEWTVAIPPGKHTLAVLARGPDASAISEPVEINHVDVAKQPDLHVLTIGVSEYEEKTLRLEFAAKDATDLFDNFQKTGKGELFRAVQGRSIVNEKARRDYVLQELTELRKKVKPNDLVVVYFAGHGVKEKDKFYLLTVEAKTDDLAKTTLSGDDLRKTLGEFPCQVLLILDACHSAGSLKAFRPAIDDLTRALTDDECGVAVMCAAMAHEKALEKQGNGLFTKAMVQALNRAEGVPFNRFDKRLYIHHLHSYVFDEVRELSGDRQHPFLSLPWVVESFPVVQFAPKNR